MSDDIKRNMDIMKATMDVVSILLPFAPRERLSIIGASVVMGGCRETLAEELSVTSVEEVLVKMRAKANGGKET